MVGAWVAAMMFCLGFMMAQRKFKAWPINKLRVWLVLMLSWMLGVAAVEASGDPTPTAAWLVIDIAAALFVLRIFRPVGFAQKLIGSMYALMVTWHFAFQLGDGAQAPLYTWFQIITGWAQWLVLMIWSAGDVGKAVLGRFGSIPALGVGNNDNGAN